MNQSEEILQSVGETVEYAKQFTKDQIRYIKLEVAEKTAKVLSELATSLALVFTAMMTLLFLTLTLGLHLGQLLDSYVWGFGLVSVFYLIVGMIIMIFRRKIITNPIIRLIIRNLFE